MNFCGGKKKKFKPKKVGGIQQLIKMSGKVREVKIG